MIFSAKNSVTKKQIILVMDTYENTWWTAKDIADVMCENISTIRNILQQLIKEGMVFKDSRSYYTSARTRRI